MCFLLIDETEQQEVTALKRPSASDPTDGGVGGWCQWFLLAVIKVRSPQRSARPITERPEVR